MFGLASILVLLVAAQGRVLMLLVLMLLLIRVLLLILGARLCRELLLRVLIIMPPLPKYTNSSLRTSGRAK